MCQYERISKWLDALEQSPEDFDRVCCKRKHAGSGIQVEGRAGVDAMPTTPPLYNIEGEMPMRPKASPIKSVSSLKQLQKPVHIVSLVTSSRDVLPEDVQGLYRNIRLRLNAGFVPAPVKDQFLLAYGSDADLVADSWFFEPKSQVGLGAEEQRATLLAQLHHLRTLQLVACECLNLGRSEAAWNSKVHQPLLDMVCGDGLGMLSSESDTRSQRQPNHTE